MERKFNFYTYLSENGKLIFKINFLNLIRLFLN